MKATKEMKNKSCESLKPRTINFERQAGPGVSGRFGTSGGSHFRHFPEIIVIQNHRSGRNSDRNLGLICRHT